MNISAFALLVGVYSAVVGLALCLMSWAVRARVADWFKNSVFRLQRATFGVSNVAFRKPVIVFAHTVKRAARALRHYRRPALVAALMVILPMIGVLVIGRDRMLDGFADNAAEHDAVVVALLEGEHLVPPPPLPSQLFATPEVQHARPDAASASREWQALNPDFRQRLLAVFKVMEEKYGYKMALLEGYRSPERQARLASLGAHVTRAGAFQSYHQFGLGADCAFLRSGKLVISERDPWAMRGYQLYGATAELAGLHWGGRWQLRDYGHIELRKKGVLRLAPKNDGRVMQTE